MQDPRAELLKYSDFRLFLKDYLAYRKTKNPSFSLTQFAKQGDVGSKAYVSLVLDGKRNISLNAVYKFGRALELDDNQMNYFLRLVSLNQAKTEGEKEDLYKSIHGIKQKSPSYFLENKQDVFFSDWRLPVIYTLLSGQPKPRTTEWIALRMVPKLKVSDARGLIEKLVAIEFVRPAGEGWKALQATLVSSDGTSSYALKGYHRAMLERAKEAQGLPLEDREISSAMVRVSKTEFEKMKTEIKELRKKWSGLDSSGTGTFVALAGFQLFPLTNYEGKGDL